MNRRLRFPIRAVAFGLLTLSLLSVGVAGDGDKGKHGKGDGPVAMYPQSAAFSPDGKRVAIGFYGKGPGRYKGPQLKIWDIQSRREAEYWRLPQKPDKGPMVPLVKEYHGVSFVAYLPGGEQILTVEHDNMCRIWKADEGKLVREFNVEQWGGFGASLTADGKKLLTVLPGGFIIWDVATGKASKQLEVSRALIHKFAVSPDGKRAFFYYQKSQTETRFMAYWDLENDKPIRELKADVVANADKDNIIFLPEAFSPDERTVLAHKGKGGSWALVLCSVHDLKELKVVSPMLPSADVLQGQHAVFSPDGTKLLSTDLDPKKNVMRNRLRDLTANQEIWSFLGPPGGLLRILSYSPTEPLALLVYGDVTAPGSLGGDFILVETKEGKNVGVLRTKGLFADR